MHKKVENGLVLSMIISYVIYVIVTFAGNELLTDIMSPVTVVFTLVLLIIEIGRLGSFKWSSVSMAFGMLVWLAADIMYFCNDYVIEIPGSISYYVDIAYYFPNAFFALCITIYMVSQLIKNRKGIAFLMSNAFCFSIIGFVAIYRFRMIVLGDVHDFSHMLDLIFFFISFYTIMMCLELFSLIGIDNIFKGTVWTNVGVLGYAILDIGYDFLHSLGKDADNVYVDLLYVLFLMLMSFGTTIQLNKQYEFVLKDRDFSAASTKKRFFHFLLAILVDIYLIVTGILPESLGMYIVITILSYLITNYVLHSMQLNEEIIKNQKEQNSILEKKVKEKTKDLEVANDNLQILSSTDVLTGLQNRRSSVEFMKNVFEESKENSKSFAVFCIDLNHFKPVNDTYGHEMGDRVLAEFGRRMNDLPEKFSSFRIGGDEFLTCLRDVKNHKEVEEAAERLRKLFNTPVVYDKYVFNLSASIGVAIYPEDSDYYELLIKYADTAMYDIKKSTNKDGYKFFDPKMIGVISRKRAVSMAVAKASVEEDFVLHFQPQMDTGNGRIVGTEVFPHLKGEMEDVSPSELIPIAEESGIMSGLGIWIVKSALETISGWNEKYGTNIGFTINLSPLQLLDADFINSLETLSGEYGFDKNKIVLDISNAAVIGATDSARETMMSLHRLGFKLSLNDFGGTDINLSHLMDCGIDYIKLSRSLVSRIETDSKIRILADSIKRFAQAMGIAVYAVGIENQGQLEVLKEMEIMQVQGYFLGKPVRSEEFEKLHLEK